jgi:hypothetical protein
LVSTLEEGVVSQTVCPGWPQILILLICASSVPGITGVGHCTQLKIPFFKEVTVEVFRG